MEVIVLNMYDDKLENESLNFVLVHKNFVQNIQARIFIKKKIIAKKFCKIHFIVRDTANLWYKSMIF